MKTVTAIIGTKGFCSVSQEQKLVVQDEFGRATSAEIRQYWKELGDNQDARRNFVWLAFVCLAQDSALDVLRATVLADARDTMCEDLQREWYELNDRSNALAEERREFAKEQQECKTIADNARIAVDWQEKEIASLRTRLSMERDSLEEVRAERNKLLGELAQYRQVVTGLKTLKELLA